MIGNLETGGWVAAVASVVVAGISGWFLRSKAITERAPADAAAAFSGYRELVVQLSDDIVRLRADHVADMAAVKAELGDCHKNHALALRKIAELEAQIKRPPETRTRSTDR